MITLEEMRVKYTLRQVGTQQEFDLMMNALRCAHTELVEPLKVKSEELNRRRHEIGRSLAELNIELGNINRQRADLRDEQREIGSIFYALKKELIRLNPKTVPPTAQQ